LTIQSNLWVRISLDSASAVSLLLTYVPVNAILSHAIYIDNCSRSTYHMLYIISKLLAADVL